MVPIAALAVVAGTLGSCPAAAPAAARTPAASGMTLASAAAFDAAPPPAPLAPPPMVSALALPSAGVQVLGFGGHRPRSISSEEGRRGAMPVLSAQRARILLRSLTVPGWGQATLGHKGAAKLFVLAETGVWATFTAFRIQEQMRRQSYERSARVLAGIDLHGRDEEFRRIVGSFLSSDEYNQLVVFRDAANLYYDDPVQYRAYIAAHELQGKDAWNWSGGVPDLLHYRAQRKDAQRASQRANTAVAVAIVNRFLSAVHASRIAGARAPAAHSWNLEVTPGGGEDATAFHFGVRASF